MALTRTAKFLRHRVCKWPRWNAARLRFAAEHRKWAWPRFSDAVAIKRLEALVRGVHVVFFLFGFVWDLCSFFVVSIAGWNSLPRGNIVCVVVSVVSVSSGQILGEMVDFSSTVACALIAS